MESWLFLAILLAALLHAGWNALVKVGLDRFLAVSLIAMGAGLVAAPGVWLAPPPAPAAWPWLALSMLLHIGYNVFLVQAYRSGDLGQVYPIARGAAPLLVAVVSALALGELPPPLTTLGIVVLVAGVGLMSLRGGRHAQRLERRAVGAALATATFIAGYTLSDAIGARASGSPGGYIAGLFVANGLVMAVLLLATRGTRALPALAGHWRLGLLGGAMSLGAYAIAIWAMTRAPIALVAALRETSVLFAALIGCWWLGEPLSRWRALAALVIVAGVMLAKLG
ncbi:MULTISPECIES: EamA family transporter [Modicisalibacter]|uniref:EamA family transporter n=1 Tax=Modicisalibacter TaxID=574347 RepID=UPI00100ACABF|nr:MULTISPECIES: EamA family transporter [Halomonadaceae]MBZ9559644.1 EamA family transporter [Modicisalibacter sp. R2A 31.J]MBZ9577096.1 EamA family transporter [Modicisalibacter sp. MOD 31.J]